MLTEKQVEEFLLTLHNPRYTDDRPGCPILLDGIFKGGKMEFFASKTDAMDYGRATYDKAMNGDYGPIAPYNPGTIAQAEQNDPIPPEPEADPLMPPKSTGLF